jgi:hypothetical protein
VPRGEITSIGRMTDRRSDIARLCENLVPMRRAAPDETAQLVAEARDGQEIGERLTSLLRRLGAPEPGQTRRRDVSSTMLGRTSAGRTSAEVFVCPVQLCDRMVPRRSGKPAPRCEIASTRFRLDRVSPQ